MSEEAVRPIDPPCVCPICSQPFVRQGELVETTVGYHSPRGHDHDDNCLTCSFYCAAGHRITGSVQRRCSVVGCDWRGKVMCCGYRGGPKWLAWPSITTNT